MCRRARQLLVRDVTKRKMINHADMGRSSAAPVHDPGGSARPPAWASCGFDAGAAELAASPLGMTQM